MSALNFNDFIKVFAPEINQINYYYCSDCPPTSFQAPKISFLQDYNYRVYLRDNLEYFLVLMEIKLYSLDE